MSQDPWERRERERERLRTGARARSAEGGDPLVWAGQNVRALGFLLGLLFLLLAEVPSLGGALRSGMAIVGTTGLLLLAALTRSWSHPLKEILLRPPGLWLLALTLWGGAAFFFSEQRGMAGAELLRLVAGSAAFLVAAYGLEPRERTVVVGGLLAIGCVIGVGDLARLGRTDALGDAARSGFHSASLFGTHENVGSLLALLFPVSLALALLGELPEKPRWVVYGAVLILGFAWVVARCRSAWLGGGVALLVLLLLAWRSASKSGGRPRSLRDRIRDGLGSPLPILVGALLVMGIGGGLATYVSKRAATLVNIKEDSSFQTRQVMWEGGARMAFQKPLTGWGLGSYPVLQGYWTHLGEEDWKVRKEGADHMNIAHNYYVQWAAEAGAPGLMLHVAALAAWILFALRAATRSRPPLERALLIGTAAAALGACVDAVGSPAYQFHGVYALLWTLMGLGSAMLGEREPNAGRRGMVYAAALALGALAGIAIPLWGRSLVGRATTLERGTFTVVAEPAGPSAAPGALVTLQAQFVDGQGRSVSTAPGTTWEVPSERESGTLQGGFGQKVTGTKNETTLSVLQVRLPTQPGAIVQVMARYSDRQGRPYTADAIFRIQGTKSGGNR